MARSLSVCRTGWLNRRSGCGGISVGGRYVLIGRSFFHIGIQLHDGFARCIGDRAAPDVLGDIVVGSLRFFLETLAILACRRIVVHCSLLSWRRGLSSPSGTGRPPPPG